MSELVLVYNFHNFFVLPSRSYSFLVAIKKSLKVNFYAGVDNLLNEQYSLGNDINAAAGRYYNAAPAKNYFSGLALQLNTTAGDQ